MGIAKRLGKALRVDSTTLNCERARFARICVDVNLSNPLKGTVSKNFHSSFLIHWAPNFSGLKYGPERFGAQWIKTEEWKLFTACAEIGVWDNIRRGDVICKQEETAG